MKGNGRKRLTKRIAGTIIRCMKNDSLEQITARMRRFVEERDWQSYQTPKNLAMALCGEAGELAAEMQWLGSRESREPSEEKRGRIAAEMADVLLYLVRIADELNIDLVQAALEKCDANARKYPEELVRGQLRLRDEYEESDDG